MQPQSWVLDDLGMYYDATRPSRLEQILQTGDFNEALVARARGLIETLTQSGTTKYNTGLRDWARPESARTVILVPGQVESDASIRYGSPLVKSNLELLQRVRKANPDAWVVYKPHPDVVAGMRKQGQGEDSCLNWCDELIADQDMAHLLGQVDEVHTLTSLAGFEALVRRLPVTCYGQPFYSGWGLTTDIYRCERRSRSLPLEALVAGALILYPRYLSRVTGAFTTVERVIEEIEAQRSGAAMQPGLRTRVSRVLRKAWAF